MTQQSNQDLRPKERVLAAIKKQATDRIPRGEMLIEDSVIKQLLKTEKIGFEERLEFVELFDLDLICLHPEYNNKESKFPPVERVEFNSLEDWLNKTDYFTFALIDGIMGWGARCFDFMEFLMLSRKSPLAFAEFIKKVEEFNLVLADTLISRGIHGLVLADDLAHQHGTYINPEVLRESFFPVYALLVNKLKTAGIPVFLHSDGNLNNIMLDIVEAGFAGLQCVDKHSAMNLWDLQQKYGQRLCFWGGLSVEDLSKAHDQNELTHMVEEFNRVNTNKGFILGTDSGLFRGIDLEGLLKLYQRV